MEQRNAFDRKSAEKILDASWHHIDFEDVTLSVQATEMIAKAAKVVMREAMPAGNADGLTAGQAMALFVDHVFWEEKTGGLIMCMDVNADSYCLPIPPAHWGLKEKGRYQQ